MILGTFVKQPADVLDYDIDYSQWLTKGDNVESLSTDVVPAGLTVESVFIADPKVKIWLSGGSNNYTYKITVTMVSADGRVRQDEFKINVHDY